MTELQRYLAEEVAEDHADGIITRREAVRRLGLLGLTSTAATSMLSTFAAEGAAAVPAAAPASAGGSRFVEWAPVATEAITFPGPAGTLMRAAVIGIYAGRDTRVNATREVAQAALQAARLRHQIVTFSDPADHAFFNDTGARFNAPAAAEAYRRVLDWFDQYVAGRGRDGWHG